jgi:transcriptional regulator with XRE-family HTH domain
MIPRQSPTVRSRRLRSLLRKLREDRGLTIEQVVRQVDWQAPKLSRIETGQRHAHPNDVRALADVYGVSDADKEALITLAREARQRGWWQPYSDALPPWFETYVGLEAEAASISAYGPELVPGLMQTEAYARAQMKAAPIPDSDEEIDKRIAVRMNRQRRLVESSPPECWVILNEAVLRRQVGGTETMHAQLTHLIDLARVPTVALQVLPFAAGAHPGTHGAFMILGFPEPNDLDVAYVEYLTGSAYLEAPHEVARYTLVMNHLRARALSADESVALIRDTVEHLE